MSPSLSYSSQSARTGCTTLPTLIQEKETCCHSSDDLRIRTQIRTSRTFPNSSGSTSSNVVQCRPITQHCPTLPGVQPALSPRREHCCVPHNMQRSRTRGTNASVMKSQSNFGLEPETLQSNFIATSMGFFSFLYLIQVPRVAVQRLHCTSSSLTWPTF